MNILCMCDKNFKKLKIPITHRINERIDKHM